MPKKDAGYDCEFCGKSYKTESGKNRHVKAKHADETVPEKQVGDITRFDPPRNAKARKIPIAYMFSGQ